MQPGSARPSSKIIPKNGGCFCKEKLGYPKELPTNSLPCTEIHVSQLIKWASGCTKHCDSQTYNPDLLLVQNHCHVSSLIDMCIAGSHLCSKTYCGTCKPHAFRKYTIASWSEILLCDPTHTMTIF